MYLCVFISDEDRVTLGTLQVSLEIMVCKRSVLANVQILLSVRQKETTCLFTQLVFTDIFIIIIIIQTYKNFIINYNYITKD